MRTADVRRTTGETDIALTLCLDGSGDFDGRTGVGFLDHMLAAFARHGRFDLTVGGYRYLNDRQVLALSQVLAMDLPVLQSDWNYRLRRIRVTRPNGMQDDAYIYSARSPYKARLLAARRQQARTVE